MKRSSRGHNILELPAILMLLVIIGMFLFDVVVIYLANVINDEACRNACRSAADASPLLQADNNWQSTAQGVLARWKAGGFIVQAPTLDLKNSGPIWDNGAPPAGSGVFHGKLRITTGMKVRMPFWLPKFVPIPAQASFYSQQELPITYNERSQACN